jgi:hypothetical protein
MIKEQSQKSVYVVTRNQRRIEDTNYTSLSDAEFRADKLRAALKNYDPSDVKRVAVVKTQKPYRIR